MSLQRRESAWEGRTRAYLPMAGREVGLAPVAAQQSASTGFAAAIQCRPAMRLLAQWDCDTTTNRGDGDNGRSQAATATVWHGAVPVSYATHLQPGTDLKGRLEPVHNIVHVSKTCSCLWCCGKQCAYVCVAVLEEMPAPRSMDVNLGQRLCSSEHANKTKVNAS